jgi:hypothetical protein
MARKGQFAPEARLSFGLRHPRSVSGYGFVEILRRDREHAERAGRSASQDSMLWLARPNKVRKPAGFSRIESRFMALEQNAPFWPEKA